MKIRKMTGIVGTLITSGLGIALVSSLPYALIKSFNVEVI
jgi:hypothetical protein